MPFSGLAESEFHPFMNMFPIHYKLWKTMTFTKEYQLLWSGRDNRGSKGDHLQDLIQRIPPIDDAGIMITDICAAGPAHKPYKFIPA